MRSTYQEEKTKQTQTGVPPLSWTPWYEIFDNIFASTAKTNGIPHSIDQDVHLQHSKVNVLSDDDDVVSSTPPPPSTPVGATSLQTPCTKATNQLGCEEQVNKSANKKKRKLLASDEAIASAIIHFSDGVLEVENMKLKVTKKFIDSEREGRKLLVKGQLQMTALCVEALKNKDFFDSSK